MEQLAIYLWAISVNMKTFLFFIGVPFCVIGGISLAILFLIMTDGLTGCEDGKKYTCSKEDERVINKWHKVNKFFLTIGVSCVLGANLIPSQRDLALIFTYPYIKSGAIKVAQSAQMKKINDVSILYLDKVAKDLQKEINGKK